MSAQLGPIMTPLGKWLVFSCVFAAVSVTFAQTAPLSVTTTSLPNATVQSPYSQQLAATGGTPPYTWTLNPSSGSLPPGLTLASNGTVSGTPTTAGAYNFGVIV